jgi:hypothetical protein
MVQASYSAAEWGEIFSVIQDGNPPGWLKDALTNAEDSAAALPDADSDKEEPTILKSRGKHGVFKILPTFSYDSAASDEDWKEAKDPSEFAVEDHINKVETRLQKLRVKLTLPFLDIDASYAMLTLDVLKLQKKIQGVVTIVGSHCLKDSISSFVQKLMQPAQHLDDARSKMANQISQILSEQDDIKTTLNNTVEELVELQTVTSHHESWVSTTDKTLDTFCRRFAHIKPPFK